MLADEEGRGGKALKSTARSLKGNAYFALLSIFWFGICQALIALVVVIWPAQIALIVGDSHKELYNGLLPAIGSIIGFGVTPVAGLLSDYNYFGVYKRRLFMFTGTLISTVCLLSSGAFDSPASSIWGLGFLIFGINFGLAWGSGPYAGVVLDSVNPAQLGIASGWQGMVAGMGDLVGAIGAGILINQSYMAAYALIGGLLVVSLIPTLFVIREPIEPKKEVTREVFKKEFSLPASTYRNFYWVIASRFLFEMGIAEILVYIQYYLQDVIKTSNPATMSAIVVALGITVGIPTSMVAGPLSDKIGRKTVVYISSCIMSIAALIYLFLALSPSLLGVFFTAIVFGLGYGAYKSVDWALALEVIPPTSAAKDMGIWQSFMLIPKVVSPLIAGGILHAFKGSSPANGYVVLFGLAVVYFVLSTVLIIPVKLSPVALPAAGEEALEALIDEQLDNDIKESSSVLSLSGPTLLYDTVEGNNDLYRKFNCVKRNSQGVVYFDKDKHNALENERIISTAAVGGATL